jgi:4-carboxymuconolactone decarboxylase
MSRLDILRPEQMTPQQISACEEVTNGPRGKVPLPMHAWLRNPELARRLQMLGELLRYETTLGPRLTELAIIVHARHYTAHVEWKAHKTYALREGLDPQVVADIAAHRTPSFGSDVAGAAVFEISTAMLKMGRLSDETYRRGVIQLGERGMVELMALLGYYSVAAFTLNAFELGLPDSAASELQDPDYPAPTGASA